MQSQILSSPSVRRVPDPSQGKSALVVIGMHRCGTSAATGALQFLGVNLGKKLYAGHQDINPKGYFEHDAITSLNDEALFCLGSCWDDILLRPEGWETREALKFFKTASLRHIRQDFADAGLWAIKDPRVCRLLGYWLDIFASAAITPCFLFIVRPADEVYQSLKRRDGFSQDKAFWLWLLHYLEAERATRGYPRCFISFDRLLQAPAEEFGRAEAQLGIRFPVPVEQAAGDLAQFLSANLKHHAAAAGRAATSPLTDLVYALEENLVQATLGSALGPDPAAMDEIWARAVAMQQDFPPVLVEHMRTLNLAWGKDLLTLNRAMRSWSHFLGKPVRFLERLLGRNV